MLSKSCCIKRKRNGGLLCSRIEMPKIWWEKPRPSERISGRECVDDNRRLVEHLAFNHDGSAFNEVKTIRQFSCPEDYFTSGKMRRQRVGCHHADLVRIHTLEKRMSSKTCLETWAFGIHIESFAIIV